MDFCEYPEMFGLWFPALWGLGKVSWTLRRGFLVFCALIFGVHCVFQCLAFSSQNSISTSAAGHFPVLQLVLLGFTMNSCF